MSWGLVRSGLLRLGAAENGALFTELQHYVEAAAERLHDLLSGEQTAASEAINAIDDPESLTSRFYAVQESESLEQLNYQAIGDMPEVLVVADSSFGASLAELELEPGLWMCVSDQIPEFSALTEVGPGQLLGVGLEQSAVSLNGGCDWHAIELGPGMRAAHKQWAVGDDGIVVSSDRWRSSKRVLAGTAGFAASSAEVIVFGSLVLARCSVERARVGLA